MMGMFKETMPKDVYFLTFFKKLQERCNLEVSWIFVHSSIAEALERKEVFIRKEGMHSCIIFEKVEPYEEVVMIPQVYFDWYALVAIYSNNTFVWENHNIKDPEAAILIKSE